MADEVLDLNDPICAACETGGNMICCDGKCLRSFHPKCIGMRAEDIPEDCPFVCADCWNGIQRCFKCKYFDIEEDLIKCVVPYCGKFYHSSCMESDDSKNICKLHRCHDCNEHVLDFKRKKDLFKCFRCPRAYDLQHRPRDVHVLGSEYFLCIRHVNEEENLPELGNDIQEKMDKRKQDKARSRADSGKLVTKKPVRVTAAASEADTEARIATAHVLPPRLGSRAAVRVPSAGNPPAITAPAVGTVASGANIVIARRKRPAAVIYSTDQTERESSATARRDISGPRKETYYSHPGNYDMYNAPYDDYPAPTPQSIYNSAKASSMFYHGGGGHFLRETDSYLYEEEYMVPHFDSYANNYLSKRRRFGVGDVGYDYGADSISRTEELLSYEMPASHSPYYITAPMPSTYHYSDDYVMPPMYPRGSPASSDHNLSRTTPVTSQFGDYTKSDQSFSASTAHWPPEPAPILPEPVVAAAPAPEPKKLDPNDLFALLSANGLF